MASEFSSRLPATSFFCLLLVACCSSRQIPSSGLHLHPSSEAHEFGLRSPAGALDGPAVRPRVGSADSRPKGLTDAILLGLQQDEDGSPGVPAVSVTDGAFHLVPRDLPQEQPIAKISDSGDQAGVQGRESAQRDEADLLAASFLNGLQGDTPPDFEDEIQVLPSVYVSKTSTSQDESLSSPEVELSARIDLPVFPKRGTAVNLREDLDAAILAGLQDDLQDRSENEIRVLPEVTVSREVLRKLATLSGHFAGPKRHALKGGVGVLGEPGEPTASSSDDQSPSDSPDVTGHGDSMAAAVLGGLVEDDDVNVGSKVGAEGNDAALSVEVGGRQWRSSADVGALRLLSRQQTQSRQTAGSLVDH